VAEHEVADANALDVRQASRDLGPLQVVDDDVAELWPDVAIELRRDDLAAAQPLALDVLDEPAIQHISDCGLRARRLLATLGDGVNLGSALASVLAAFSSSLIDRDGAERPQADKRSLAFELILVSEADESAGQSPGEEAANFSVANGGADRQFLDLGDRDLCSHFDGLLVLSSHCPARRDNRESVLRWCCVGTAKLRNAMQRCVTPRYAGRPRRSMTSRNHYGKSTCCKKGANAIDYHIPMAEKADF
jgi:hypothetical protein